MRFGVMAAAAACVVAAPASAAYEVVADQPVGTISATLNFLPKSTYVFNFSEYANAPSFFLTVYGYDNKDRPEEAKATVFDFLMSYDQYLAVTYDFERGAITDFDGQSTFTSRFTPKAYYLPEMKFDFRPGSGQEGNMQIRRYVGGSVPEPATWTLMILGFGATAGAVRRRQRVRHAATGW